MNSSTFAKNTLLTAISEYMKYLILVTGSIKISDHKILVTMLNEFSEQFGKRVFLLWRTSAEFGDNNQFAFVSEDYIRQEILEAVNEGSHARFTQCCGPSLPNLYVLTKKNRNMASLKNIIDPSKENCITWYYEKI